ncbi:MAG: ribose transport system substrate-binding protein [Solirubrobacteraceae bacterium]
MTHHRKTVRLSVVAALTSGALVLAACGSSNDNSSSTSSGSSTASGSTAAAADPKIEAAKAEVAKYSKAPSDIGVSEALEGSVRGKKVVFEQCLAPICALIANNVKAAAQHLGVTVQIISTGATPDTITKAFNSGVAAKPDAMIASTIPTALWTKQLAALDAAGVPVITNATLAKPSKGVVAQFYPDAVTANVGVQDANWVISDSGGKGKTVYVFTPEFAGLFPQVNAYRDKLKADCPGCSYDRLDVKSSDVGKVIPGRVVSYLQQHPDVKYVIFQYGDLATGVPQALKGASISGVKLASSGGGPVNYQYIKSGDQLRDMSLYLDVYSWQIMDATAKAILKQAVTVPPIPEAWITKDNADFDPKQQPPFGNPDWQGAFLKLWAKST